MYLKHTEAKKNTISAQEREGSFPYKELNPSLFFELSLSRGGGWLLPLFPVQLQTPGSSEFLAKVKQPRFSGWPRRGRTQGEARLGLEVFKHFCGSLGHLHQAHMTAVLGTTALKGKQTWSR